MASIQGPGGITPPNPANSAGPATPTAGKAFGRSISATEAQLTIPTRGGSLNKPLVARSISLPNATNIPNNDILTPQGLKNIAGDPKSGLLQKSPTYTKLLDALSHYQELSKNPAASSSEKQAALDNITNKAQVFSDKKSGEASGKKGDKLEKTLARIKGAENVITAAKTEKTLLQVQELKPSSLQDIQSNIALYEAAGPIGAESLHNHLTTNPPSDTQSLLSAAELYNDEALLEKHFNQLPDANKARTLMVKAPTGSPLQKIAAESWAPDKVKREVPILPKDTKSLDAAQKALVTKLQASNVPKAGIDAAVSALAIATFDQWENDQPVYGNINTQGQANASSARFAQRNDAPALSLDQLKDFGNALHQALNSIDPGLQQGIDNETADGLVGKQFRQLHQPRFNGNLNMMTDKTFTDTAKPRYAGQQALACNRDTAVQVDGQVIYHANHIDLPSGRYIGAQGPREQNQESYWKMIGSEGSAVSVDLTDIEDRANRKSSHYTPEVGQTTTYPNGVTISNLAETKIADGRFTIQQLEVNGQPHTRIQSHVFPDKTSGNPADLAALAVLARQLSPDSSIPIAVHCSAGIGRTGTFITVMDTIEQARNGQQSNPQETIATFRDSRGMGGVQKASQLHTILQTHQHSEEILLPLLRVLSSR